MIFDKKYDIFISYRHNNMTLIGEVVHRLEKYYDVFWDQRLESGYWNEQLTGALDNSSAVLINLTVDSLKKNTKNEDWFYKEIVYSIETKNKEAIIPVCYDGFSFPENLDIEGITAEEKEKLELLRDKYQRITDIKSLDLIIEKIIQYLSGIGIEPKEDYIRSDGKELSLKIEKIVPVKTFVGREKELNEMIELVHTNDIVFLSGMGGIGKTELAKKFMEEMTGDYRCIFVKYDISLKNTLSKIEINGLEDADFAKKEKELKKLLTRNVVLIIDNFDFESDENIDDYIYEFCQYPCKKLITTRNLFNELEFPCDTGFVVLDTLNREELKKLFEEKYKEKITDAQLETILKLTGGLTLIVPILASLCLKSDMTIDELCKKIENEGLENTDSVNYVKDGNKKGSVPEILRLLFNIDEISEEKKKTLRNLSLLKFIEVTKAVYRELAFKDGKGSLDAFNELVDEGWIKQTGHNGEKAYYELHPLIDTLVKDVLKPSVKNCPEIFKHLREKSGEGYIKNLLGYFLAELNFKDRDNYEYLSGMKERTKYISFYCEKIFEILSSKETFDDTDALLASDVVRAGVIRKKALNKKFLLDKCLEGRKNRTVSQNMLDNFIRMYCILEIEEEDKKIFGSPDYESVERLCNELMKKCSSRSIKKEIKGKLSSLDFWVKRGQSIKVDVEAVLEKLHQSEDIKRSFELVETVWRICGLEVTFRDDIFMHFLKKDSTKEEVEAVIDATLERYGDQDLYDEYNINEGYHIGYALSACCIKMGYDFLSYEKCFEFFKKMFKSENVASDAGIMSGDTAKLKTIVDEMLFSKPVEEKTKEDLFHEGYKLNYMRMGFSKGHYTREYAEKIFGYAESVVNILGSDRTCQDAVLSWLRDFEKSFDNEDLKARAKELRKQYIVSISGIRMKNE